MLGRTLTRVELGDRIEEATRRIAQNYQKGLKEVEEAKTKINDLELSPVDTGSAKNNRLNSALDLLMQLTDSMIFESGRAWDEYEKLKRDCKVDECESSGLNGLREMCKKTEEFATDLLCYSLAHFRKGTRSSLYLHPQSH
jgi:hypothetical protein